MKKVTCYGEILWDNLPTGKQPGGAPMNVAYHLNQIGISAQLISRVGDDDNGTALCEFLNQKNLPIHQIQVDRVYATSTVEVFLNEDEEIAYDIVFPVAWDFIELNKIKTAEVKSADAFVFGSLAARSQTSRDTLMQLLPLANYRVFDVNLRAPHYEKNTLNELLQHTNLLKLNVAELDLLGNLFTSFTKMEDRINALREKFEIAEILLTKGTQGCTYYADGIQLNETIYKVKVADTVGSGDSFLAAFLAKKLQHEPIESCLAYATLISAFITSKKGACPNYSLTDIEEFHKSAVK